MIPSPRDEEWAGKPDPNAGGNGLYAAGCCEHCKGKCIGVACLCLPPCKHPQGPICICHRQIDHIGIGEVVERTEITHPAHSEMLDHSNGEKFEIAPIDGKQDELDAG